MKFRKKFSLISSSPFLRVLSRKLSRYSRGSSIPSFLASFSNLLNKDAINASVGFIPVLSSQFVNLLSIRIISFLDKFSFKIPLE